MSPSTEGPIDVHQMLLDYQDERLSANQILVLFAYLVKSGLVWILQPDFGRTALMMLGQGLIREDGLILMSFSENGGQDEVLAIR